MTAHVQVLKMIQFLCTCILSDIHAMDRKCSFGMPEVLLPKRSNLFWSFQETWPWAGIRYVCPLHVETDQNITKLDIFVPICLLYVHTAKQCSSLGRWFHRRLEKQWPWHLRHLPNQQKPRAITQITVWNQLLFIAIKVETTSFQSNSMVKMETQQHEKNKGPFK